MIKIAARHHPFSHRPGASCLLPGTNLFVKIYPARLSFFRAGAQPFHVDLECVGPVLDFTVELDLESARIRIFGHGQKGYMHYVLKREGSGVVLIKEKQSMRLPFDLHEEPLPVSKERLSLGMHKKLEWERVASRLDFKEIFPIWMRLGQCTPPVSQPAVAHGSLRLLQHCQALVQEGRKQDIISAFKSLFLAGFEGILAPRLFDTDYQGILPVEEGVETASAMALLTQGAALIRSLFLREEGDSVSLLPCLPPDFHAGRCVALETREGDRLDFEWTKKEMRRVVFYPAHEKEHHLQFCKQLKKCRVRSSFKEKGKTHVLKDGCLNLVAGDRAVFIDCFKK